MVRRKRGSRRSSSKGSLLGRSSKSSSKDKTGFYLVSIVAVVAVVALVLMFNGSKDVSDYFVSEDSVVSGEESTALAGQAIRRVRPITRERDFRPDFRSGSDSKSEDSDKDDTIPCSDSDAGLNYTTKGKVHGIWFTTGTEVWSEDYCIRDTNILVEKYCRSDNTAYSTTVDCKTEFGYGYSCIDGACVYN